MSVELRRLVTALSCVVAVGGCAVDNPVAPLPQPSFEYFACAVQPVLDRNCSFGGCHGNVQRGMQVLSPSRMRIASEYAIARLQTTDEEVEEGIHPALTNVELSFNYEQARGWSRASSPDRPAPILDKPLAVAAGGLYHTTHGDLFASKDDDGYKVIEAWLHGATAAECP
ncbi:MAG: hypothetical protein EP329_06135 [Deltaproteobacteria bacterium]|nr:MAG: hypothetical protein EP329_06135 [Deltaproteobacteria bacterium]